MDIIRGNENILAMLFCMACAFVLYELSGLIGREMLADKHITGKGVGYCDITFGRDSNKSLIVNMQYNIFGPVIYMLLAAAILQYFGINWLLRRAVCIVPCYYLVRAFMITVVSSKSRLYNWGYEMKTAAIGVGLSVIVHFVLILSGKLIMPTVEEFRTQIWLLFFALAYQFVVRTFGRSPKFRQNKVCTDQMKRDYIIDKYYIFQRKYGSIVKEITADHYLQLVVYSIMIYENYNRTRTQRWGENIVCRLSGKKMTLGIMQVETATCIDDRQSVKMGSEKIKNTFYKYVNEVLEKDTNGDALREGEQELCLEKICDDYNGAADYPDAIKYIFYELKKREVQYGEEQENQEACPQSGGGEEEAEYAEVFDLSGFAACLGRCRHVVLNEGNYWLTADIEGGYAGCYTEDAGRVFWIENLKDTVIEGVNTSLLLDIGQYIVFRNCRNVILRNISFRRTQQSEAGEGAVVRLADCTGMKVETDSVTGTGGLGLELKRCRGIQLNGMQISNCSHGALDIEESDVHMIHCTISGCKSHKQGLVKMNSSTVRIEDTIFRENSAEDNLLLNENSILACSNLFISNCRYRTVCSQKIGQGVIIASM